ncbi:MAG TPA: hypothetical protein VG898_11380 [Solirubrobacterales bacterium]|nr:hypothetical protein [Solirubrobacterales bacterium]
MPIHLTATIELSDDQLSVIAAHLPIPSAPSGAPRIPAADPAMPSAAELPEEWRLVEEQHGVTYAWPEDTDVYEPFRIYEGTNAAGTIRFAVGACERTMVRGEEREYFITGHVAESGAFRPIAEFLATDDYEESGETIAIVKGKEGRARMYDPGDELPAAYSAFRTETYRDRIEKPHSYNKIGIVAGKDDAETMLGHTFIQAVTRLGIYPD